LYDKALLVAGTNKHCAEAAERNRRGQGRGASERVNRFWRKDGHTPKISRFSSSLSKPYVLPKKKHCPARLVRISSAKLKLKKAKVCY
jgi:hypothetical protein